MTGDGDTKPYTLLDYMIYSAEFLLEMVCLRDHLTVGIVRQLLARDDAFLKQ